MFGRKREKIITIRINEKQYDDFLKTIKNYTTTYEIDFPSRTEKRYYTKFPDKSFSFEKYTLADLVEEAIDEFIKKYKPTYEK